MPGVDQLSSQTPQPQRIDLQFRAARYWHIPLDHELALSRHGDWYQRALQIERMSRLS